MLKRELVSNIINNLKLLNKDDHVSRRYILNTALAEATTLIAQKLTDKSIFREDNIYRTIEFLEMEKIDVVKCGIYEFRKCNNLVRSKHKLPKLLYSRYGNSILEVTSVDGSVIFLPTTLSDYKLFRKRILSARTKNIKFYYVQDGYLYLPDCEFEYVNVTLITLDTKKVEDLSTCKDCNDGKGNEKCKSQWDYEFICPDKLLTTVINETFKKATMLRQVVEDNLPNMDSNQKTHGKV